MVESQVIAWVFYYLGVMDGSSATLETFKGLNPEPLKDAKWQTELRSYLPAELAALRQPHANRETAARVVVLWSNSKRCSCANDVVIEKETEGRRGKLILNFGLVERIEHYDSRRETGNPTATLRTCAAPAGPPYHMGSIIF